MFIAIQRNIVRHKAVYLSALVIIGLAVGGSLLVVNSNTSVRYDRIVRLNGVSVKVKQTIKPTNSIPPAPRSTAVNGDVATHAATKAPATSPETNQQAALSTTDTAAINVVPASSQPTASSSSVSKVPSPGIINDYPSVWADAKPDTIIDTWGMLNRESVSYTAWKVNETFGNMPTGWSNGVAGCYPSGFAKCWIADAQASGIPTGMTPAVHSVGITTNGATGFSAWIESVSGTNVTYSSYNCSDNYNFCTNTVPRNYFNGGYIYFAK